MMNKQVSISSAYVNDGRIDFAAIPDCIDCHGYGFPVSEAQKNFLSETQAVSGVAIINPQEKLWVMLLYLQNLESHSESVSENLPVKRRLVTRMLEIAAPKQRKTACLNDVLPKYQEPVFDSTAERTFRAAFNENPMQAAFQAMLRYPDDELALLRPFMLMRTAHFFAPGDSEGKKKDAVTGIFEQLCKSGKPGHVQTFWDKFSDLIDLEHPNFQYRPLHWLSLIVNFYNFESGAVSSPRPDGYIETCRFLERKLGVTDAYRLSVGSHLTEKTEFTKADYVWLYCDNTPKMNAVLDAFGLAQSDPKRKELLCIRHFLWQFDQENKPDPAAVPKLRGGLQAIEPVLRKLLAVYSRGDL